MKTININKIDLSKFAQKLKHYQQQWIAVSESNEIVAAGSTYAQTLIKVKNPDKVILFKVPPLDYSLSPHLYDVQISKISHRRLRSE